MKKNYLGIYISIQDKFTNVLLASGYADGDKLFSYDEIFGDDEE